MTEIDFKYQKTALFTQSEIQATASGLKDYLKTLRSVVENKAYDNDPASLILSVDNSHLKAVRKVIAEKRELNPTLMVVVGIGGSNLGTMAVAEAVLGKHYNLLPTTRLKILYADTVDSDNTAAIIEIIKQEIRNKGRVLLSGVSKSGSTTETISLFQVLLKVLKKEQKDYQKYIVLTSDKGSKFWDLGVNQGFSVLEIPAKVGGRYSVLSPVGLFPLGMLGVNLRQLLAGAKTMLYKSLESDLRKNPAAISASLLALHLKNNRNINDNFVFDVSLEAVGKWYRQLMGESVGKEKDLKGKVVHQGMTPTVSVGSVDLHSLAQLYLGGPYDKFTTFIGVAEVNKDVPIPKLKDYAHLVSGIQGKQLTDVMGAIYRGTKQAFVKGKRPFVEIILPDRKEASVGQLLQFKMVEMMYLAQLLGVNAFDQPNVEDYKAETRKFLLG